MSQSILAAVISGIFSGLCALGAVLLKDHFFAKFAEDRKKEFDSNQIISAYLSPLAHSAEKLLWRFHELYVKNRHQFLLLRTLPLSFNQYKRTSTLYRLAALLGWMRALDLELSSLRQSGAQKFSELNSAIDEIRRALADGPDVETRRLDELCALWRIEPPSVGIRERVANLVELKLYEVAGDELRESSELISQLGPDRKLSICRAISNLICKETNRAELSDSILRESIEIAISKASYRETWIYRDWQDAIGDSMLVGATSGVRRFSVKTFSEFDGIVEEGTKKPWISTFKRMIDDIDLTKIDPNDFRVEQLKRVGKAVANLVQTLEAVNGLDAVSPSTAGAAKELSDALK
ncbi:MAG: hypothetical protein HY059_03780 [Proteobacteria bacterium]|nr:hypothetical protein [Pseudomonadota bacterium]